MAGISENNGQGWRELCAAAAVEPDAQKLASLVDQILQAFDERDREVFSRRRPLECSE